jgi:hypothetical protein
MRNQNPEARMQETEVNGLNRDRHANELGTQETGKSVMRKKFSVFSFQCAANGAGVIRDA